MPNSLKDLTAPFLFGAVGTVVSLLVTQGLISSHIGKVTTAAASVAIFGGFAIVHAVLAELKHATAVTAIAAIATVAGLLATNGFVTSGTEKLVDGLAAAILPAVFVVAYSIAAALSPHVKTRNTLVVHGEANAAPTGRAMR